MMSNDAGISVPLFVVHEGEGREATLQAGQLARMSTGAGMPVHGLCIDAGEVRRPFTIEGMATRLVDKLHAQKPRGPYRLAGLGAGGVLAYEMAVQLVGRDQPPEFIGLIDSPFPAWPNGSGDSDAGAGSALLQALKNYAIQPMPLTLNLVSCSGEEASGTSRAAGPDDAPNGWEALVPRVKRWHTTSADAMVTGQVLSHAMREAVRGHAAMPERQHGAHVVIQSGRRGEAPILCVPGAGDSVIGFIPLSEALGTEYPLHGLQPRGVEGLLVPHATVEAAAAFYLEATAALRAAGPVHLVGHSFGGWIVFEMAARLRAAGQPVASLSIIDSEPPDGTGVLGGEYTSTSVLMELMRVMEQSAGKPLGVDADAFTGAGRADQLRQLHAGMVRIGLLPRRSDVSAVRGLTRTFATALRTTYRPACAYPGPVGLVLAHNPDESVPGHVHSHANMLAGWRRWAPEVSMWTAPGDHFSILRQPHVRALGQWWHAHRGRLAQQPQAAQAAKPVQADLSGVS